MKNLCLTPVEKKKAERESVAGVKAKSALTEKKQEQATLNSNLLFNIQYTEAFFDVHV